MLAHKPRTHQNVATARASVERHTSTESLGSAAPCGSPCAAPAVCYRPLVRAWRGPDPHDLSRGCPNHCKAIIPPRARPRRARRGNGAGPRRRGGSADDPAAAASRAAHVLGEGGGVLRLHGLDRGGRVDSRWFRMRCRSTSKPSCCRARRCAAIVPARSSSRTRTAARASGRCT